MLEPTIMNMLRRAPTTGRSAGHLSRKYGFRDPAELAETLPKDAKVADFGAGKSNFGAVITELRDDITWINLDIRTGLFRYAQRHQQHSGPRLQYIKADVFNPPIRQGALDRVYSSWLLPHIELDSRKLALQAVHTMAALLNDEGILAVNASGRILRKDASTSVSAADYHAAPAEVAAHVVDTVALNGLYGIVQKQNNTLRGAVQLHNLP